ncbi:HK97-gp10 family putative phage morphogenesis protein [Streptomyces shenzhenensis]|uniref:HK97-gp10 family putative phage morphogenesis protein n=1 Tax=Streptomyces shenzhenensis TaxID=943815 RepID=UPI003D93C121
MSIEGLPELRRRLEELPAEVRAACFRALRSSVGAVVDGAKGNVKVDTGNLRSGVKARFENSRLRAEVGWWDRDDSYAVWQEFGTRRMLARPALGPALEEEKQHLPDRIKAEVRRAVR